MPQPIVVDFSDVETFEPLPVDWYDVEVADARVGQSQAGNAKVTLQFKVIDGEHEGRNLIADLVLEGRGRWKTKQAFEALLGEAEGTVSLDTDDLIGAQCTVRVVQRAWREEDGGDGSLRNNISAFKPLGSVGVVEDIAEMFEEEPESEPERRKLFG